MTESHVTSVAPQQPKHNEPYQQLLQRESLYRVLATNIVSQLHETGHGRQELVGFASAVLKAINEGPADSAERNGRSPTNSNGTQINCEVDENGPQITGDRVLLVRPCQADRTDLDRWSREPLVQRSLFPAVLAEMLENLPGGQANDDRLDFLICENQSRQPLGAIALFHIDRALGQAELAKMIGEPNQRGRGFAREATRLLLTFAFDHLQLNRVTLKTLGGNLKNIKLNERIGFQFEGVMRQAAVIDGEFADVVQMSMLRDDFQSAHADGHL